MRRPGISALRVVPDIRSPIEAPKPKSDLYRDLLLLINSGKVRLLDNKRFVNQLRGLERTITRSDNDSIGHAKTPSAQDDVANAVAGALLLTTAKRRMWSTAWRAAALFSPTVRSSPRIRCGTGLGTRGFVLPVRRRLTAMEISSPRAMTTSRR